MNASQWTSDPRQPSPSLTFPTPYNPTYADDRKEAERDAREWEELLRLPRCTCETEGADGCDFHGFTREL